MNRQLPRFRLWAGWCLLPCLFGAWAAAGEEWVGDAAFRIPVTVDPGTEPRRLTPVSLTVDFGRLLAGHGDAGRLDRHSIRLYRADPSAGRAATGDAAVPVPHQLSRDFYYGDAGAIHWRIRDERDTRFVLYFDILGERPARPPERVALIGNADTLLFNHGRPGPLDVGMAASVRRVDWDADGLPDLLVGSSQTHEYNVQPGRPAMGFLYFFRNTGERDETGDPIFAAGYQLRDADGNFIENNNIYLRFELIDWDGDGHLDILTALGEEFTFYRNTAARNADGLPLLRKQPDLSFRLAHGNDYTDDYFYSFPRIVDWDGDGRPDIIYAIQQQHVDPDSSAEDEVRYWDEVLELFELHANQGLGEDGRVRFAPPVILKTARGLPLASFGYGGGDVADWDGDGRLDLIVSTMQNHPQDGCRVLWFQNTGEPGRPNLMLDIPIVERDEDTGIDPNPHVLDWDDDGDFDLLLGCWDGWLKIYENLGDDDSGLPRLAPGRFVLQIEPKITGGEQTRSVAVDWDGDGSLDIIQGGGNGWVTFYRNLGDVAEPVFAPGEKLRAAGTEIRLINGPRDCPQGPSEPNSGYTTPVVVDFDADGDLDLFVGDMRGYQSYFENIGARTRPELAAGRFLTVGGERRVFGWRNQLAVGDITGDGRIDIVSTGYTDRHVHLYHPEAAQDEPTQLKLVRGEGLRLESGEVMLPEQGTKNNNGDYMLKLADWNHDGLLDLFIGSLYHVWYYENVGSAHAPRFREHGTIMLEGRPMHFSGHAGSVDVVDFNGDRRMDLIIAGESGWTYFVERSFLEGNRPTASAGPLQSRP
ncbi:MAG: FG-GAP repeat protein [candidate division BRC1 bacterium ADurb.BinA292]|nr:MAG: FG-GAP repeat protein [candidate division BRC1 bacterium ADurb.BinA292]